MLIFKEKKQYNERHDLMEIDDGAHYIG